MHALSEFFMTAAGSQLRRWELSRMDSLLSAFAGEAALQVGSPYGCVLRNAPHRQKIVGLMPGEPEGPECSAAQLLIDFEALPFREQSFDLVVAVHALERACSPEAFMKEIFRVLAPEGRFVLLGLNPWGPWWMRKKKKLLGPATFFEPYAVSSVKRLIAPYGVIDRGQFGVYSPSLSDNPQTLVHWSWCEKAGDRWWPVLANGFMLGAVKKVDGMRLVGKLQKSAEELLGKNWEGAPVAQCRKL
ncbi:MAG TPA: class I SAM-dependent methyltransferase [Candidatus Aphodousia gallistercoris]|nr:class I SAM-dependent methyltransferase [Candidatus Aphodousia gallistercoris]